MCHYNVTSRFPEKVHQRFSKRKNGICEKRIFVFRMFITAVQTSQQNTICLLSIHHHQSHSRGLFSFFAPCEAAELLCRPSSCLGGWELPEYTFDAKCTQNSTSCCIWIIVHDTRGYGILGHNHVEKYARKIWQTSTNQCCGRNAL